MGVTTSFLRVHTPLPAFVVPLLLAPVAPVPTLRILQTLDAVLALQLRDVVVVSVSTALLAFLRFAPRQQRSELQELVTAGRTRVKLAKEAARQRLLAAQQEQEAAHLRAEEQGLAKVIDGCICDYK